MKLKTTILFAAILLALVSVAGAAEQAVVVVADASATAPSAEKVLTDALAAPALAVANCDKSASSPFVKVAFENDNETRALNCGACSTSNCVGAPRGQMCWINNYGWGHCNIYSGGYLCPTGGWECQCGIGPLP